MTISGLRTSENFSANERPKNFREAILRLYPNGKAPLTALTSMMKERSLDDPEFNWWEKKMQSGTLTLLASTNLASSAGAATLTLDVTGTNNKAQSVKSGDLLMALATKEIFEVLADPSANNTIKVQRGAAGSSTAALDADGSGIDPRLVRIGSAFEEGSLAPSGISYDPSGALNYCQIFRETLELTNTAKQTRLRTGDSLKEAKRDTLETLSNQIELALFWGNLSRDTKNSKPRRTMKGLYNFIPTANRLTPTGGALDMDTLEDWMVKIFAQGSDEKIIMGGNGLLNFINKAIRKNSSYDISVGVKEYGMRVTRIISPFGELVFKTHPLFTNIAGSATYDGLGNIGFVIDQANLRYAYLKGRDVKYQTGLQVPGMDGLHEGYLGELSMEVHHPETHFYISGVTSAAKDS